MSEERVTVVAGSDELLIGALPIESGRVTSRRILKAAGARIVRLSLDEGQVLKEHTAAVPVLVNVLSGRARVDADGSSFDLPAGAIIHIEAQLPHSVEALTPAHLLLTLLDGYDPVRLGRGTARKHEHPHGTADAVHAGTASHADAASHEASSAANTLVLASSGDDSAAVDAITRRHADLSGALATNSARLLDAAASTNSSALTDARDRLLHWCHDVLVPQLSSEAGMLYPAADDVPTGSALVARLREDIDHIGELLQRVKTESEPTALATATVALRVAVARHLTTESEQLLPLLAASREHSLATLWRDVESKTTVHPADEQGETDETDRPDETSETGAQGEPGEPGEPGEQSFPELDVRTVPHAIRHATVFGALDAVQPGEGLVLIAPHDPLPLLAQIEQRAPNRFGVSYLSRGPEDWRLQFLRAGTSAVAR